MRNLEILVFTYNRAENLAYTLTQLRESPFADCKLTVLDNASTDATPAVCEEHGRRFRDFHVVRHRVNIGLGPNYLRAVELSRSTYSWVLSDDETFDFSDCGDVLDALGEEAFDLISLGSPGQYDWERGLRTTTQELVDRGARFLFAFTFVAGVIFRTALFDSHCVAQGYRNVDNLYPQIPFLLKTLELNSPVYVSKREVVRRTDRPDVETVGSNLYWFTASVRSNALISDPAFRRRATYDGADTRAGWVRMLAENIALERLDHPERLRRELVTLFILFSWDQRLLLLLLTPLALVPRGVYARLRSLLRRRRSGEAPAEGPGSFDPLRL